MITSGKQRSWSVINIIVLLSTKNVIITQNLTWLPKHWIIFFPNRIINRYWLVERERWWNCCSAHIFTLVLSLTVHQISVFTCPLTPSLAWKPHDVTNCLLPMSSAWQLWPELETYLWSPGARHCSLTRASHLCWSRALQPVLISITFDAIY